MRKILVLIVLSAAVKIFSGSLPDCSDPLCTEKTTDILGQCRCVEYDGQPVPSLVGGEVLIDPFTNEPFVYLDYSMLIPDPDFFSSPALLPFLDELKNMFDWKAKSYRDAFLRGTFNNVESKMWGAIQPVKEDEKYNYINTNGKMNIENALTNIEIYLADVVYRKMTNGALPSPDYDPSNYVLYTYNSSGLYIVEMARNMSKYGEKERDVFIELVAEYLLKFNLLALMDRDIYEQTFLTRRFVNTMMFNFLTTPGVATFLDYNNLCIRAMAPIALEDFSAPDGHKYGALNYLEEWIKKKYSTEGVYSEGSDYLDYVNTVILPFYYIAERNSWISRDNSAFKRVKNSGNWLLKIVDPSGYFPEIDDACGGQNYIISPYIGICQDDAFRDIVYKNMDYLIGRDPVLSFLTYSTKLFGGGYDPDNIKVSGNIGKINMMDNDDTVSLTLITENGDMLTEGGAHDQQDHGSFVIRRATNNGIDQIILDPLYGGFGKKFEDGKNMKYSHHNTLQVGYQVNGGVYGCPKIDLGPLKFFTDCGGGSSEICNTYKNGFRSKITLDELETEYDEGEETYTDEKLNASYYRSVINFEKIIFIFDWLEQDLEDKNIYQQNIDNYDFTLHFNLPYDPNSPSFTVLDRNSLECYSVKNHAWNKVRGNSKIKLEVFSNYEMNPFSTQHEKYWWRNDESQQFTEINSVKFKTVKINPYTSNPDPAFISVIDVKGVGESFNNDFSETNIVTGDVTAVESREIDHKIMYAFQKNKLNGDVCIHEVLQKHYEMMTDAGNGVVLFDTRTGSIEKCLLYEATYVIYNGISLNIGGDKKEEMIISGSGTSTLTVQLDNDGSIDQINPKFRKPDLTPIINLLLN